MNEPKSGPLFTLTDIGEQDDGERDGETASLHNAERDDLNDQHVQEQIADLRQDREQRKKYSESIFHLVVAWLVVLALIVVMDGACCVRFQVSERVLLALIGSTTASIFGLFYVVTKYLFPKR